jgi:hypothetical protein
LLKSTAEEAGTQITRPLETLTKTVPDAFYEFFAIKNIKGESAFVTRNPRVSSVSIVSYSKNAENA